MVRGVLTFLQRMLTSQYDLLHATADYAEATSLHTSDYAVWPYL
jgi:hypothetical protein